MNKSAPILTKLFAAFAVGFASILSTGCESKLPGPALKVERKTIDLGNVNKSENPTIRNSITLINKGSEDLIVKDVSPSCDCVSILGNYPDTLSPGEKRLLNYPLI